MSNVKTIPLALILAAVLCLGVALSFALVIFIEDGQARRIASACAAKSIYAFANGTEIVCMVVPEVIK